MTAPPARLPRNVLRLETPAAFAELYTVPLGSVRWRAWYGGRGSAKSWQFARALLIHGMNRRLRILCAREYQASMRQSVYRVIVDMIKRLGLQRFYRATQTEIVGMNGTEFLFVGLRRDIEQVKSIERIDICWVEEAQSVSDPSWETLIPTIRAAGSEIWVSFNPAEETDATYQRLVVKPPDPKRAIIRKVTWRDNPYLPRVLREEREELLRTDPEAEAHVWGGETWKRSEAQVLRGKWIVKEFVADESYGEPLFGVDWGFAADPTVALKIWRKDKCLWVEYEAGGLQMDNDDTAIAIRELPGVEDFAILADNARPETINEMKKRGLRVVGAEKWDGSVKDGIAHLRTYDKIVIHPRCTMTIRSARLWRYKTDPRSQQVISKLHDGNDDPFDACRYALSKIIRQSGASGGAWFPGMDGG